MKNTILLALATLQVNMASAQAVEKGDYFPEELWKEEIYNENGRKTMASLKGKFFIIDFWNTNCTGCIRSFPKIDAIAKQHAGSFTLVLVNVQNEDSTKRFFEKRRYIVRPKSFMNHAFEKFWGYFPSSGVPHYVWVNPNGQIISIGQPIDSSLVAKAANGDYANIPSERAPQWVKSMEKDFPRLFQTDSTIWGSNSAWFCIGPDIIGQTAGAAISVDHSKNQIRYNAARDLPIVAIMEAFSERLGNDKVIKKIIVEDQSLENFLTTGISLDIKYPTTDWSKFYKKMQNELLDYFDIEVAFEERPVKCHVLRKSDAVLNIQSQGGKTVVKMRDSIADSLSLFLNTNFSNFLASLKTRLYKGFNIQPFVDQTGITGNIDLRFSADLFDRKVHFDESKMKTELLKYGLILTEDLVKVPVIVIKRRREAAN